MTKRKLTQICIRETCIFATAKEVSRIIAAHRRKMAFFPNENEQVRTIKDQGDRVNAESEIGGEKEEQTSSVTKERSEKKKA